MSKRAWLGDATLALVALTTLVFMIAVATAMGLSEYAKVHSSNAAYQQNAEHDRRIASEEIASACENRTGDAFRVCIADRVETYYRDQATNEDLQAQQDMAFWAAALFVSSTTLTAIGIWLLYRTLSATQQTLAEAGRTTAAAEAAVTETRRIGEAQVRAYLSIESVCIAVDPDAGNVKLSMDINNAGQSPARKAEIILEFVFAGLLRLPDKATTRLLVKLIPANTLFHQQEIGLQDINIPQGYSVDNYRRMAVSLTAVVFANDVFDKEVAAVFSGSRVHSDDIPWTAMGEMLDMSAIGGTIINEHGLDIYRRQRFWGDQA